MPTRVTGFRKCVLATLMCIHSTAWAADRSHFAITQSHPDANGVTLRTTSGSMRIEVCGDRVIHVVVSPTSEIPPAKIPIVSQPCKAEKTQVASENNQIKISTNVVNVTVDTATGALTFLSKDGTPVLAEPEEGGKAFDVPSIFESKAWNVQQTFRSPSDEALYGLGQHQEGIFDLRGVPVRLHQANTNISIPFLLSSKGYGILWNNPSLTDVNPADQPIAIDPNTGKGKFTTGAKGVYGFLLASDNKDRLLLEVNGHHVIDLQNMWLPTSASGYVELEANKEYEISARGGPSGTQLAVRPPQDTTTFRSEVGK